MVKLNTSQGLLCAVHHHYSIRVINKLLLLFMTITSIIISMQPLNQTEN
jgi:hypothetical protein